MLELGVHLDCVYELRCGRFDVGERWGERMPESESARDCERARECLRARDGESERERRRDIKREREGGREREGDCPRARERTGMVALHVPCDTIVRALTSQNTISSPSVGVGQAAAVSDPDRTAAASPV